MFSFGTLDPIFGPQNTHHMSRTPCITPSMGVEPTFPIRLAPRYREQSLNKISADEKIRCPQFPVVIFDFSTPSSMFSSSGEFSLRYYSPNRWAKRIGKVGKTSRWSDAASPRHMCDDDIPY